MIKEMRVFMAKFHKDKPLENVADIPDWLVSVQAGAALTEKRIANVLDSSGENISHKNPNYCELTVLYWLWKNYLSLGNDKDIKYYGLFHYRRWLDIRDEEIKSIIDNDIDVILPYPTVHEPDIREHHMRYISESDWNAVLCALRELSLEYYAAYDLSLIHI